MISILPTTIGDYRSNKMNQLSSWLLYITNILFTNRLGTRCNRSLDLGHQFVSIQTNLDEIVQQSEERCERKRSDKDGYEAILDHCNNCISRQQTTFKLIPLQIAKTNPTAHGKHHIAMTSNHIQHKSKRNEIIRFTCL